MNNNLIKKLMAGIESVIPEVDFIKKISSGKKLKIKFGADPTSPDLHLGHAVVLSKLRQFQDLGHEITFLIGDFTAQIGDPTGRSKTRPILTKEQIQENTRTYFLQVTKILDPNKLNIVYNSQWLDVLNAKDIISLCSKVTLSKIIEREDFKNRIEKHQSISFHELLYPLFQGYDSVVLNSELEIGGTDQTFNMLMARPLQEQWGQEPQIIMTVPLLEGIDGHNKMSKSLNNAIGLNEPALNAYGKLLSISDELMWRYYSILLHRTDDEINSMKEQIASLRAHPINIKKAMAYEIISKFWSKEDAELSQKNFEDLFQKKCHDERDYSNITKINCSIFKDTKIWIVELLKYVGAINSTSQARDLILQGAISINNHKIIDFKAQIQICTGDVLKVGKHRFYRLEVFD